jgi:hypothetical protein
MSFILDFYVVVFWIMILGCLVGGWYPSIILCGVIT